MFIGIQDIPFIIIIAIGVFLPEVYLRMRWSLRTLTAIRFVTLLLTCALATFVDHFFYPNIDTGTIFVRAFIFVGVSRMIMLSSHQVADVKPEKKSIQRIQESQ